MSKIRSKEKKSVVSLRGLMAPGKRAGFMAEHCQVLNRGGSIHAFERVGWMTSKVISNTEIVAQTEKNLNHAILVYNMQCILLYILKENGYWSE